MAKTKIRSANHRNSDHGDGGGSPAPDRDPTHAHVDKRQAVLQALSRKMPHNEWLSLMKRLRDVSTDELERKLQWHSQNI